MVAPVPSALCFVMAFDVTVAVCYKGYVTRVMLILFSRYLRSLILNPLESNGGCCWVLCSVSSHLGGERVTFQPLRNENSSRIEDKKAKRNTA